MFNISTVSCASDRIRFGMIHSFIYYITSISFLPVDKKSNTSEATSQSDSKTSEQSAEKAASSSAETKDGEKESGDGSSRLVFL